MNKFNDTPFISLKKEDVESFDKIEVNNFASCIADFISKCQTPMTVGLQGDWGTGKTSLMNMIKCYLPDKKSHKIDVNTWHYSIFQQDEYLGIVIIKSLVDELAKKFEKKEGVFYEKMKQLGSFIGTGLQKAISVGKSVQFGIPGGGVSINDIKEAVQGEDNSVHIENLSAILLKFKQEFTTLIHDNIVNERIYFFIDDLDRIRPSKAVEVLETLKNFMDVEGCVFVLAVDYEIVQLGIAEKFGKDIQRTSGKSFFDKIIQLPFRMPTSSYNIENYIADLLTESEFYKFKLDINEQDRKFFVDITEVTVGRNPRSIKRAINYASLLELIRAKNSKTKESGTRKGRDTTKLLYTIVCMQIAWPELFEYFALNPTAKTIRDLENWDFLDTLPDAKRLFSRVQNVDEVKDNISAFFDTLYSILDVDEKDGVIKDNELKPLVDVLKLVKLTSEKTIKNSENPLISFRDILVGNNNQQYIKFFESIYMMSYWGMNENLEYKKAGGRYYLMVWNRKQIGSLVTLKGRPFVIRLKENKTNILEHLEKTSEIDYSKIVKDLERANTFTGIGDTEIDCQQLMALKSEKSIDILNKIFQALIHLNDSKIKR